MAWYNTGTISITNGTSTVTGVGTGWVVGSNIFVGEGISLDGKIYEISAVNSATSLTIARSYAGTTLSGAAYGIVPVQGYVQSLAAQVGTLTGQYTAVKNGDLSAAAGGTVLHPDGAAATPGMAFSADPNTGVRRVTTDTVALVAGGADTVKATATTATVTGALSVTGNTTLGDASTDTVTVNGYMGVGGAGNAAMGVRATPNALTGASQYGIVGDPTSTSAATTLVAGVWGRAQTAATAYTTSDLVQFYAAGSVKGAGSTITNQHGVYIADQINGTNNYGITSLVSSGTNKWNAYFSGTARNYMAGALSIGATTDPGTGGLYVAGSTTLGDATGDTVTISGKLGFGSGPAANVAVYYRSTAAPITGSTTGIGLYMDLPAASDVTNSISAGYFRVNTAASAYTLTASYGVRAANAVLGAGSSITSQYGLYVDDLIAGDNNYGITSAVSSGAGKWNIYASGTAANYFAGNVGIGGTTLTDPLNVNGIVNLYSVTSGVKFTTGGLYGGSTYGDVRVLSDRFRIYDSAGTNLFLNATTTEFVVNEGSSDYDFRVESDTNTHALFVEGSSGNVGIGGVPAAGSLLHTIASSSGTAIGTGMTGLRMQNTNGSANTLALVDVFGSSNYAVRFGAQYTDYANNVADFVVGTRTGGTFAERLRISSDGNVGIGVTPGAWYTGYKAIEIGTTLGAYNFSTNSGLAFNAYDDGSWKYRTAAYAGRSIFHTGSGYHAWLTAPSGTAGNPITFTQAMTLDASGNLGLGVTPSAWISTYRALQVGGNGVVYSPASQSAGSLAGIAYNAYVNSGGTWTYQMAASEEATNYYQQNGAHIWQTAGVGTAGNPITFTQAMTLDTSARLLVNQTAHGFVNANSCEIDNGALLANHHSSTTSGTYYAGFAHNAGIIGSITQNGTTAVAFNTTSDHRLKTNVRPANAAQFMSIRFRDFEWIDGRHDCGVIAHELAQVYPDLVLGEKDATEVRMVEVTPAIPAVLDEEGNEVTPTIPAVTEEQTFPVYQQVNYIGLIGRMGTVIQQQQAQLAALESRLAALESQP